MSATTACPHCKNDARVRSSRALTPTYRQLYLQCGNVTCGHTFAAELTITHTISPSACPDPTIELRQAPPRRRAANDNVVANAAVSGPEVPPIRAANDDDPLGEAVATGG